MSFSAHFEVDTPLSLALSSAQLVCALAHAHQSSRVRVRETSANLSRSRSEVCDIICVALLAAEACERSGNYFHSGFPNPNSRLRGSKFHTGSMALRVWQTCDVLRKPPNSTESLTDIPTYMQKHPSSCLV